MSNIRIPVSFILDDDGSLGVLLLSDDERSRIQARAAELRDAGDIDHADAIDQALATDAQLHAQPNAVHATYVFRRPTTQDRMLMRHTAYDRAASHGEVSDWVYEQYLRLIAVETLREDTEPLPDDLIEHVAALLDSALATRKAAADFLDPVAAPSPEGTK